jgi:outer membrane protein assembly factor BamB
MVFREPSVERSILFAATGHQVVAADALTGKILWRRSIGSKKETALTRIGLLGGDHVVAAREHDLLCLDQASGAIVWQTESPIAANALVVSPSRRILAARGGEIACFDEKGSLLWHEVLGGEGPVSLAFDGMVLQADEVA